MKLLQKQFEKTCGVLSAIVFLVFCAVPAVAFQGLDPGKARVDTAGVAWYDVRLLTVEGKGWEDTEGYYDRLPARARALVREPVWDLSRNSAGLCVRFRTDATELHVCWDGGGGMPHMAATGRSGVDLYVEQEGQWKFLRVGKPEEGRTSRRLVRGRPGEPDRYLMYLPLYNRVTEVEIGVPEGAAIAPVPPPAGKPVVFYGTSITQGGCASRPGMAYPAILGRWLDRVTINLGFSGNGRMEPEVAGLLAELDPAAYVIDCIPNVGNKIGELTGPLVQIIRKRRPGTPILLVEDARIWDEPANRELRLAFNRLIEAGDRNVYLLEGKDLLGGYGVEATVDTRHPTDLGFIMMAKVFEPVLTVLLGTYDPVR
ncbi:MAG: SGNH/GDSL hydrolase family protein [Gemmatimonadota bacterium]|nr:SGNH/GDSL hydrolase family protein [Gemmatimonadota bacterium]